MELEVGELTGAAYGERSAERLAILLDVPRRHAPGQLAAGDAHVAGHRRALVPAVDDEIMALGLARDAGADLRAFAGRVVPRDLYRPADRHPRRDRGRGGRGRLSVLVHGAAEELVPRAGATRDTPGMINMVADAEADEVLGVSMVGEGAAEVIHEAAMALRFRARIEDFVDLLHV